MTTLHTLDLVAGHDIQVDIYAATADRKVVCLNVDGITRCRVTMLENIPIRVQADRDLTVVQR